METSSCLGTCQGLNGSYSPFQSLGSSAVLLSPRIALTPILPTVADAMSFFMYWVPHAIPLPSSALASWIQLPNLSTMLNTQMTQIGGSIGAAVTLLRSLHVSGLCVRFQMQASSKSSVALDGRLCYPCDCTLVHWCCLSQVVHARPRQELP